MRKCAGTWSMVIGSLLLGACGSTGSPSGTAAGLGGTAGSGSLAPAVGASTNIGGASLSKGINLLGTGGSSTASKATCSGTAGCGNGNLIASGPACGDGLMNQAEERCDDGNSLPGDGCSGICHIEPNFACPTEGSPCKSTIVCGDGTRSGDEACDDNNTAGGDGCSTRCTIEPGYVCATSGQPCQKLLSCGDGRVATGETCDDGNQRDGDGCSSQCRIEPSYRCGRPGTDCDAIPVCGDGRVSTDVGELCDDGNSADGDGCSSDCRLEATYFDCSIEGQTCKSQIVCGDGILQGAEQCDDANTKSDDGCSAKCVKETGWLCRVPGRRCVPFCGDGQVLTGYETCDDGNASSQDGCSSLCQVEPGFACPPTGGQCSAPVCGDGKRESGEPCDDGNDRPFDGCYQCVLEPSCPKGVCKSVCGDGKKYDDEACDDGNTSGGDGCSADCKLEGGFTCKQVSPTAAAATRVPVLYRDFVGMSFNSEDTAKIKSARAARGVSQHVDFSPPGIYGSGGVLGVVHSDLGDDGTPSLVWPAPNPIVISSPTTFAQWYHDDPTVNLAIPGELVLEPQGDGSYLFDSAGIGRFDPLNSKGFVALGLETAQCTTGQNLSFTTETHFWFEYQGGETFAFSGDDDVWVFVNGRLVIDLGDLHGQLDGSFTLSNGAAAVTQSLISQTGPTIIELGLVVGGVYEIAMFHAERQYCGSNFKLTLRNFQKPRTECIPTCGDGIPTTFEECDDGTANRDTLYGGCRKNCTLGPYCGDGRVQNESGEQCDDGKNVTPYGGSGCGPGCRLPARCGDGSLDVGEQCDLGDAKNSGAYGGCTATCRLAPYCGDGMVQHDEAEQCDDGLNIGGYGYCASGCQWGPHCGDKLVQSLEGETCDDGNDVANDGCTNCGVDGYCGDGILSTAQGEACDDGKNDGSYGSCTPQCARGPHCGDGVVQASNEACDDGTNAGGYGECAPGCRLGPHCGDGIRQSDFEECDDGNVNSNDGCSSACRNEIHML